MNKISARCAAVSLALVMAGAALSGCSQDPQEKYDSAVEQLKEARQSVDDAQEKINSKKEELKELQNNLDESQSNLAAARGKVDEASQAVNKTVNDEVLFRTIQRELLDKKQFDKAAISVGVTDRVVTLTGNVPDEKTHQKAVEAARSQAGVENVVDQLQVTSDQDKQKASQPQSDDAPKPSGNKPASPGGSTTDQSSNSN